MKVLQRIKQTIEAERQYFSLGKAEIARQNLSTMMIIGWFGSLVCVIFFIIAPVIISGWHITVEYYFVIPMLAALFCFAFFYGRSKKPIKPLLVQAVGAVFYVCMLAVFIALSAFPYPDNPQIFISLSFMFMPALLIQRPATLLTIMAAAEIVYVFLAAQFKSELAFQNDVFNTVAAFFFSIIIITTTNRLRYRDFTARAKLEKLSQTDALTKLMNKTAFETRTDRILLSIEEGEVNYTFMVLDMDNFKHINDTCGHPLGDLVLETVGGVLRQSFRQSDLVGRIGGDEFAVLLSGLTDDGMLRRKFKDIEARLSELQVEGKSLPVSFSAGAAVTAGRAVTYAEIFRAADAELYKVKESGKGDISIVHTK